MSKILFIGSNVARGIFDSLKSSNDFEGAFFDLWKNPLELITNKSTDENIAKIKSAIESNKYDYLVTDVFLINKPLSCKDDGKEFSTEEKLKEYVEYLLKYFKRTNIILVSSPSAKYIVKYGVLSRRKNYAPNSLQPELDFVELSKCCYIDLLKYYFADAESKFGIASVNFEEEGFVDVGNAVKNYITNGETPKKQPNVLFSLKRFSKYEKRIKLFGLRPMFFDIATDFGLLVIKSGGLFVEKYAEELEKLYYDAEKGKKISNLVKGEMKSAFITIKTLTDCSYAYVTPQNKKKMLAKLRENDVKVCFTYQMECVLDIINILKEYAPDLLISKLNIEKLFDTFLKFIGKDDKIIYEKVRAVYLEQEKPALIDIWGSCIAREFVNFDYNTYLILNNVFYRNSLFDIYLPPIDIEDKFYEEYIPNRYESKNTKREFQRLAPSILKESNSSWLIFDLYDLVEEHYYKLDDENYFVLSGDAASAPFLAKLKEAGHKIERIDTTDISDEQLYLKLDKFAKLISEKYGKNIIMIDIFWQSKFIDYAGDIDNYFKDFNMEKVQRKNKLLMKCHSYLAEKLNKLSGCYEIDFAKNFYSNNMFVFGGSPSHYENLYYEAGLKIISEIVTGKTDKKYFSYEDIEINEAYLMRLKSLKDGNKKSDGFSKLSKIDEIFINIDSDMIFKYTDKISEIYRTCKNEHDVYEKISKDNVDEEFKEGVINSIIKKFS